MRRAIRPLLHHAARWLCLLPAALLMPWPSPAPPVPVSTSTEQVPAIAGAWPVGNRPPVSRGWDPPATPYGRGHRGVDLTAPAGTPVRAVAPGRVTFAGQVAGRGVVTISLTGTPLRTTYEPVTPTVPNGTEVTPGTQVATLSPTPLHCPTPCLHWGLRTPKTYLNPLLLLPPWLLNPAHPRLLPVLNIPVPRQPAHYEATGQTPGTSPTQDNH
ncbi:M23 family metallopeptidase [Streptomyces sp. NPDC094437]|uniref:M23 family metallopeptidase n=1 Tax=Streptomyces sp. NPDC094437 TaxID=3366060 RepID=UPI00382A3608